MKKFLTLFAVAALGLFAVSCEDEEEETTVELKSIELSQASLTMNVGDEATLTVTYKPDNATEKPAAEWASSDATIASVAEGKVIAVAAGNATITATVGKLTANCSVTVMPVDEPVLPEEGDSEWSVVGTLLSSNWGIDKDYVCAKDGDVYVLKNVKLTATDEFKFRKDKDWADNRGGNFSAVGEPFTVTKDGPNIIVGSANVFDLYYNAATEEACVVLQNGTPTWSEIPEPQGIIAIDGDFSDWANIEGLGDGNYGMFKFAFDDNYVYFYTWRNTGGRYSEIWGDSGYVYVALDLDKNMGTGVELWGNGPYEFVGVLYPFGGSAEAPEINEKPGDACMPADYTLANAICKGVIDAEGAKVEIRVPRKDLPALTDKFDIYSWGNKDLTKVMISYPFEMPDTWDYTPSAEYLADDNIWKAVDAANTVTWFYNPNWAGEQSAPETSFKESTWTVKLGDEDTAAEWTTQMKIHPATELLLDTQKKYTFTAKVFSSTGTHVFFKMYQDGVDWPESFESPAGADRIAIAPGETKEIKVENFIPLGTPQILLIDFAQHGADNTIHVKDITLKVTGEVEQPVSWDYTPGEEYLASNNLWKPVFDANAEKYYYYHCTGADWNGTDTVSSEVPFLTKNESTYELTYEAETGASWQNQLFIFPDTGHEIPFAADKTYKVKVTMGTNASVAPGFFKLSQFDANNAKGEGAVIWEKGSVSLMGAEPIVIETPEITGVECGNIILVMDFGGNPADTKIYIKDITVVEVAPAAPATIAEIIKAIPAEATGSNTAVTFEANLAEPATVSYVNGRNAYFEDATGAILLYLNDHGFVAGDTIKGKLSIKAYWYNGIPEMVAIGSEYEKGSGAAVSPKPVTIAELLANYDAYLLRLVKISGVTVTDGIADGDRNGEIAQGDDKVAVYAQINNGGLLLTEGAYGDFVTIPAYYKTNKQVYLWDNAWFTAKDPSAGGSGVPDYDPITGFTW